MLPDEMLTGLHRLQDHAVLRRGGDNQFLRHLNLHWLARIGLIKEVCLDTPHMAEESCRAATSSGESATAPGTHTPLPAWPWAGGGPYSHMAHTPYNSLNSGITSTAWPCTKLKFSSWSMPYVSSPPPTQSDNVATGGVWPYPSVPNTVPLGALPYGDYSMPLREHLTPATKENYNKANMLMYSTCLTEMLRRKNWTKDEKEKEKHRRKKPDRIWVNWLPGFLIYAEVIVKAQPWRAQALFQYLDII